MPGPSAHQINDKLEHGSLQDFTHALTDAYNTMNHDDFKTLLLKVKEENDFDLGLNSKLPRMSITTASFDRLRVDVASPSKYLGTLWRDNEIAWMPTTLSNNVETLIHDAQSESQLPYHRDAGAIAKSVALDHQAYFLENQKNIPAATKLYDTAIQAAGTATVEGARVVSSVLAIDAKAAFLDRQGDVEGAEKLYRQANEYASTAADLSGDIKARLFSGSYAWDAHAAFLEKNGKTAEAAKLYDRAIETARETDFLETSSPTGNIYGIAVSHAKIAKAGFLERTGNIAGASELFDDAINTSEIAHSPASRAFATSSSLNAKAEFLERQGKTSDALKFYTEAIEHSVVPMYFDTNALTSSKSHEAIAAFFERQGNKSAAIENFDEAYRAATGATMDTAYGLAASSASIAKYEFLNRQKSGQKAPYSSLSNDGAAEGYQLAFAWHS